MGANQVRYQRAGALTADSVTSQGGASAGAARRGLGQPQQEAAGAVALEPALTFLEEGSRACSYGY